MSSKQFIFNDEVVTVVATHSDDDMGGGTSYFIIEDWPGTVEELKWFLSEHTNFTVEGWGCAHSYDCCGNLYPNDPDVSLVREYEYSNPTYLASQRWIRNI